MIKYRAEIDGLRTVAVIPVILFHLGYSFINGGYYGVDVFFVISGYLITKILTDKIEDGTFSMYDFWIRRIKRLLPVLLTVIIFTLIIAPVLIFKPDVKDISKDVFPAIFSYFNFHALLDFGNYWGGKSEQSFFLHTWSLSVEEQFYLVYPFFLFFAYKYFKKFILPIFVLTICSFCLFLFYLKINKDVDTAFYMLPTRMWELSIGGMASLIRTDNFKFFFNNKLLPILGIFFIALSYFFGGKTIGYAVVLPVIGSVFVILFCSQNDMIGKLLSAKPFVFTGKLSYSLYLWHWPVIILFKNLEYPLHHLNQQVINVLVIALTFMLSFLSYTYIENKTRNYSHTPKIVIAGIVIIAGIGLYFQSNLNIYYDSKYSSQTYYVKYYDISPKQVKPEVNNPLSYCVATPERLSKVMECDVGAR